MTGNVKILAFELPVRQCHISVDEAGVTALANVVLHGGFLASEFENGSAGLPLQGLRVHNDDTQQRVTISIEVNRGELVCVGAAESRSLLAQNIRAQRDAEIGHHLHVEWHPDHFYLAEQSIPTIIDVVG